MSKILCLKERGDYNFTPVRVISQCVETAVNTIYRLVSLHSSCHFSVCRLGDSIIEFHCSCPGPKESKPNTTAPRFPALLST